MDFNSQPHEEADSFRSFGSYGVKISTHSLTKRLTIIFSQLYSWKAISTHSLTKRLTIQN